MRICSTPGCPKDATRGGRCERHQRKAWIRPSKTTSVTSDPRWPKARRRALAKAHYRCATCKSRENLEVHHRQPISKGGAEFTQTNLQVLCHTCHKDHHRKPEALVILVGLSGTGKTAIREQLAARLGVQSLGPDEMTWTEIHERIDRGGVLECARIPGRLARRVGGLGGLVIQVTAPPELRADRMRRRGDDEETVAKRLAEIDAISYEDPIQPDKTIQSIGPPAQIAASLAAWVTLQADAPEST